MKRAVLALADGRVFEGRAIGADGEAVGEVVFNTAMTGYQEILTDPSYRGQMVTMTYPLIGNYGVNNTDVESRQPYVSGFIVKEAGRRASNWRAVGTLDHYLCRHQIIGIDGLDTRALTRHIRDQGEQVAVLSTVDLDPAQLVAKAKEAPGLVGRDLVREVTCAAPYEWPEGLVERPETAAPQPRRHVVVYDFGVKHSILRSLVSLGCRVTVVPAATSPEAALAYKPDGIVLSNGPGDPAALGYAVKTIQALLGKVPIFGICLGHQLLGTALGGTTYKLKFGHHGGNHPVIDLTTGSVKITTQNHGFGITFDSASGRPAAADQATARSRPEIETPFGRVRVTHLSLNDGTIEGLQCLERHAFSVQYHPEAAPGPHDARYMFPRFVELMARA